MILRLWSLQVIDYHDYAKVVTAEPDPSRSRSPPPGVRSSTATAPCWWATSVQQEIVALPGHGGPVPPVIGELAALVGQPPAQVDAAVFNVQLQPVPAGAGHRLDAPLVDRRVPPSTHSNLFPGVSVAAGHPAPVPPGRDHGGPGAGLRRGHHRAPSWRPARGPGTPNRARSARAASRTSTRQYLRGAAGIDDLEVNASGPGGGHDHGQAAPDRRQPGAQHRPGPSERRSRTPWPARSSSTGRPRTR